MTLIGTSAPWEQVAMPAVDLRRMLGVAITSEGVQAGDDLKVSQRAAGANMSVDVAAGKAYIKDDHAGSNAGGFYWAQNDAVVNLTITTADATNPRIDRVILEVRDAYLGDAASDWRLRVVAGTPTAGATLSNLNGAAAVPSNAILLANVLVDAGATSIADAKIDTGVRSRLGVAGSGTTYRKTSEKDVANTTTETDLLNGEITIAAGVMSTDKKARCVLLGDYLNNTGANRTMVLKIKLGGTVIWEDTSDNLGTLTTRRHWRIALDIAQRGSANANYVEGRVTFMGTTASQGATTGRGGFVASSAFEYDFMVASDGDTAIDFATAKLLEVTVTHSTASASLSMRLKEALVEII